MSEQPELYPSHETPAPKASKKRQPASGGNFDEFKPAEVPKLVTKNPVINEFLESDPETRELNAEIIQHAHEGWKAGLPHFRLAGRGIASVHERVKREKQIRWSDYCKEVFGIDQRTANNWMRLDEGKNWEKFVEPALNAAIKEGKPFGLNKAMDAIKEGSAPKGGAVNEEGEGQGNGKKPPKVGMDDLKKLKALLENKGLIGVSPEAVFDLIVEIGVNRTTLIHLLEKKLVPETKPVNADAIQHQPQANQPAQ